MIAEIYKSTVALSEKHGFTRTPEQRLKCLTMEVFTLGRPSAKALSDSFDVIWNTLDYLRLMGHSSDEIEVAFKKKIADNSVKETFK